MVENGGVDTIGVVELVARVIGLDDMSVRAVLALSAKAEVLADLKIVAEVVDGSIHNSELVG